jgi:hypothetical protein
VFVFKRGGGLDVVYDFDPSTDLIRVEGHGDRLFARSYGDSDLEIKGFMKNRVFMHLRNRKCAAIFLT